MFSPSGSTSKAAPVLQPGFSAKLFGTCGFTTLIAIRLIVLGLCTTRNSGPSMM